MAPKADDHFKQSEQRKRPGFTVPERHKRHPRREARRQRAYARGGTRPKHD